MPENTQETRTALEEAAYHKLNKSVGEGTVVRVVGPVVDVKFDGQVPGIYTALIVDGDTPMGHVHTVLEVESQLEGGVVRTVAMSSTDGLTRGLKVKDTGHPMMMPVGPSTLGRVWNVIGEPARRRDFGPPSGESPPQTVFPDSSCLASRSPAWCSRICPPPRMRSRP